MSSSPAPSTGRAREERPRRRGCLRVGCIGLLLLSAGCCGFLGLMMRLPSQLAHAAHAKIRVGASLREVLGAAEGYRTATGSECGDGVAEFRLLVPGLAPPGHLSIAREGRGVGEDESLPFEDQAELLRLLDARPALLTCRRLWFVFRVKGVPPKTSFAAEFGEDGRVSRVTQPATWD